MKTFTITALLLIFCLILKGQGFSPEYEEESVLWADSVLNSLSLDEKIAQLMMVTVQTRNGETNEEQLLEQIEKYKVGGVLFLKSSPHHLANWTDRFQKCSKVPLFIAIDAENGLSFRMDSVPVYPNLMGLGAIQNDSLLYWMGREIGQQCKALGINMNFAPVVDVNSNPDNPIINFRSFGEDPARVAKKSLLLARGMQDEKIIVVAKHFPGHGDTSTDSHHTLPVVDHSFDRLDSVELVPYRLLISEGITGIMSAHIHMKKFDNKVIPATMSSKVIRGLLCDTLQFRGLIISDAMNMKGISSRFNEGEATVEALKAGIDMVEFIRNPETVIAAVRKAIETGTLKEKDIEKKCRKVLWAKSWINRPQLGQTGTLSTILSSKRYELTSRLLFQQSLTILKNDRNIVPLKCLDTLRLATFSIGEDSINPFQSRINDYLEADHFFLPSNASLDQMNHLISQMKSFNLVVVSLHSNKMYPGNHYGLTDVQRKAVEQIALVNNCLLVLFTNVYSIKNLEGLDRYLAIVATYSNHLYAQDYSAQLLFGAFASNGKLPASISKEYTMGSGIETESIGRLKYSLPEEVGINSALLGHKIDSVINRAIQRRIFPGCQLLVARRGTVFLNKAYGFHTYDSTKAVSVDHLYDLASVTKIAGPLPLVMKMTEDSLIDLDRPVGHYFPPFKGTNKESITMSEILTHQAGLKPGILFQSHLLDKKGRFKSQWIRNYPSEAYSVQIFQGQYLRSDFQDSLIAMICKSELLKNKGYVYSDLGFMLLPEIISSVYEKNYEDLLNTWLYRPLGAKRILYNPHQKYPVSDCPPTEEDYLFRKNRIMGFVHDESAAIRGGVSGHAGLFANANDLAKIMQMYLQDGQYGGRRFLNSTTVSRFSKIRYPNSNNRRGLGFDKPYLNHQQLSLAKSNLSTLASPATFGHTGFTGTVVWADPQDQVLFIFLSNRTWPKRSPLLSQENIRPKLHQLIYELQGSFNYSGPVF